MPAWAWVVVLVLLVASRPIEVRLWRAGRLSDEALTILLLSRFPIVSLIAIAAESVTPPLSLLILGISVLPLVVGYRWVLRIVREQHREIAASRDIGQR